MAIRLEDEYTNSNAADTQYPGGSFKNRSVQGIYDGTPLEQKWANDFLGFFWRLLVVAGITPSGSPDTSLDSDYYDALLEIITDALGTHSALTIAHSATATPTANRMAAYDSGGRLGTNAPVDDNDCVQYGQFGRSLSANGYQRLPGGLIIQWGLVNIPTSNITITLPIAFPTAGRSIVASLSSVAGLHSPQAYFVGNSQAFFDLYGTNAETAYYIAIGY